MIKLLLRGPGRWLSLLLFVAAGLAGARTKADTLALQARVLGGILDTTAKLAEQHEKPAAAFDLDDTLFLTAPRTKAILLELAAKRGGDFPDLQSSVTGLVPEEMPHGIVDTLKSIGMTDPSRTKEIKAYWLTRFLSGNYLTYDWPMPGALDFLTELRKRGATIFYVTARSYDEMKAGTESALRHFGFPLDDKAVLKMNGARLPAPKYKAMAVKEIARDYVLTGLFENEPENLNAMKAAAPLAQAVFIDTVCTPGAPPLAAGIPKVRDFRIRGR